MNKTNETLDILAIATTDGSFYAITDFPGCDEMDIDSESELNVVEAIFCLLEAKKNWMECGENSAAFGRVDAMINYGIVTTDRIKTALTYYRNRVAHPH